MVDRSTSSLTVGYDTGFPCDETCKCHPASDPGSTMRVLNSSGPPSAARAFTCSTPVIGRPVGSSSPTWASPAPGVPVDVLTVNKAVTYDCHERHNDSPSGRGNTGNPHGISTSWVKEIVHLIHHPIDGCGTRHQFQLHVFGLVADEMVGVEAADRRTAPCTSRGRHMQHKRDHRSWWQ
jgi:hypothetical protein